VLDANDAVGDDTFLVSNHYLSDHRPLFRNMRRRPMGHHQGKAFPRTALIKGEDPQDRYFIVQEGSLETRLVRVGPEGKSVGDSFAYPSEYIEDRQPWHEPMTGLAGMDARGVVVIPLPIRQALGIAGSSWLVDFEQCEGGIFIRLLSQMEPVSEEVLG